MLNKVILMGRLVRDPDRPLEQWEQDWIADVQRRREQMGVTQE